MLRDPVCGQRVHRSFAYIKVEYEHFVYHLCCPVCQAVFEAEPERLLARNGASRPSSRTASGSPTTSAIGRGLRTLERVRCWCTPAELWPAFLSLRNLALLRIIC